eukprot:TRINITY_DN6975_c0_g2_i2.p2 TRINITY_DN6975_c0_g2~~TRINITY_DN6975_c0_g2_i2.p2  ORF type:complete len:108 (-),score=15.99 TRINITY_DN6975_c0_g2_i2:22-345(-)
MGNLGLNKIGTKAAEAICKALNVKNAVRVLNLALNQINDAKGISKELTTAKRLEYLNLGWNKIGDESVDGIREMLRANRSIIKLGLSFCKISEEGRKIITKLNKVEL